MLQNQVYSADKVGKDVRARAYGLRNIKKDSSNNIQGYRMMFHVALTNVCEH